MKVVDPSSAAALADRATFHNGLRECPVTRAANGDFYYVAGFDHVKRVMEDHEVYTKQWGSQLAPMEHRIALNQDPPDFNEFKRIYTAYMSPGGVKRWAGDCERIANEILDAMEPLGSGDIQQLFGKPVSARVTARVLGFPEDMVDTYRRWTDTFLDSMIRDPGEQLRVIKEMYAFFDQEFERRRQQLRDADVGAPTRDQVGTVLDDSLTSVLMTTPYRGRYLDNGELRRTIRGFFVGGVDTTGALMLNTLHHLLKRPTLWKRVQDHPDLIDAAVEETLRYDPPALGMFRGTTGDVEIGGETIPEGSRVLYSVMSANRDPSQFDYPDVFKLDRRNGQRHMAFGSGAHFCPGAWTARMEAAISLRVFIRRLPKLKLTGPVDYFPVVNFLIVKNFPAAWD